MSAQKYVDIWKLLYPVLGKALLYLRMKDFKAYFWRCGMDFLPVL
jgi:hypothetical protein